MASEFDQDIELILKRAISGVVTFTLRTFFLQIFTFFATFVLTILLEPTIFGVFFLVSAILNLFVYFSDVGLAAALIQKKEQISKKDLATTFTIQQIIILSLMTIGLLLSDIIAKFYNLNADGLLLLRILIFSLLLSSLKTIPSIILERQLKFGRLIIPQIVENIIFYTVAIILALMGFGVAAFTWAVLSRGIVGLVLIYVLSPWMPNIAFDKKIAKQLTSFGLPFQINSILALIKDDLLTVFLGKILPLAQIGYLGWAQKWAYLPLRFFMDNVNKVTFPAYSRLQDHPQKLSKAIEKSIFFVTYFVYPSIFGMLAIAPTFIEVIPKYNKWEPALPLLYLYGVNTIFSAVSTTFTNALFSTGRPRIVLKFMVFWTSATWILTFPLVFKFGYLGVGIASAIVAVTSIGTIYFVKKEIPISVGKNIIGPLAISIVMFFLIKAISTSFEPSIFNIVLSITTGVFIYFALSLSVFKRHLVEDAMIIIKSLLSKT